MKQAFLIVAHKNFEQTKQLIEFIADEDHHVYIHIDQKNDGLFNQHNLRILIEAMIFII